MTDDISSRKNKLSDEQRALLAARLKGKGQADSPEMEIPKNESGANPLSLAQERLWFLHQLETESTAYNIPRAFRLKGELKYEELLDSLRQVIQRHDSLRMNFVGADDDIQLRVNESIDIEIPLVDLSSLPSEEKNSSLTQSLKSESDFLFTLADGPLIRVRLFKLEKDEHVLFVMTHHAISDGWSFSILLKEWVECYDALVSKRPPNLDNQTIQYVDYAAWQRKTLQGKEMERQLAYWRDQLGGDLPVLNIPTDKPRPVIRTHKGGVEQIVVDPALIEKLTTFARSEGATLYMVLLAAFNVLLYRFSGQDDLVVGSPVANRTKPELEGLIGFFANTLALRARVNGNDSFIALLSQIKSTCLGAYDHQDTPFQELVQELQPERDMSRTPIYQALFSFMDSKLTSDASGGAVSWSRERVAADVAQTDLALFLEESDTGLLCALEYSLDLYEASSISRLLKCFNVLLECIVNDPSLPVDDIQVMTEGDNKLVLETWNDTKAQFDQHVCIHNQFENAVEQWATNPAVFCDGQQLSFQQLEERANQIANYLVEQKITPDTIVGVCVRRSVEMIASLLGVMKAGAAYLPLDPEYPIDRLRYMIEDSDTPLVIVDGKSSYICDGLSVSTLCLQGDKAALDSMEKTKPAVEGLSPTNLAYVIYTSGSTGKPKGVMVQHNNVINFFAGMDERIQRGEKNAWLAVTSISFDISVLEMFWSLSHGFKLVVYSGEDRKEESTLKHADKAIDYSLFYFSSDASAPADRRYDLLWEGIQYADQNNFKAVWTPERHFHAFGGLFPSPAVASAAIAAKTKNVDIRAGSLVLPLHSPIRATEEWALVDNLSQGRVGIAFAPGWQPNDFALAPQNYADRNKVMAESIDIMRKLWRGESVNLPGGDGKEFAVSTLPRPIQSELPYWITTAGNIETFKKAGAMGANLLTHLLGQTTEELAEKLKVYRDAREENGHDRDTGVVTLMLHTFVGPNEEYVLEHVKEPMKNYLRGSISLFKPWAEVLGLDFDNMSEEDEEVLLEHSFSRYFQNNGLFGTPKSCIDMVDNLKGIGVNEIAALMDFGVPTDIVVENFQYLNQLRINTLPQSTSAENKVEGDFSIAGLIRQHDITHLQCTPSMASMLIADEDTQSALDNLNTVMIGGEAFPIQLASDLRQYLGNGDIINMYGPTETTIWSSTHKIEGDENVIPLGLPISNTQLYVLDAKNRTVPIGAVGELVIGGASVVRGYYNRPQLTAERFIDNPYIDGGRAYRTGDLVRFRNDGTVEFLGRNDFQVKIRGYRIELGEIESLIRDIDDVNEVAVIVREDVAGDKRLVAYLTKHSGKEVEIEAIKAHLRKSLADYMVPSIFVVLDAMPLTPNAKIDRNKLPKPTVQQEANTSAEKVAPQNELQSTVAGIWGEVLNNEQIGIDDNFFDLGGHSMLIVHVMNQLKETLNLSIKLTDLFRYPTIRGLAEYLGSDADDTQTVENARERGGARREAMAKRRARRR